MFRDPQQLTVFQQADALALTLVRALSAGPLSPIGCTLSSAAIRPALRIQEACRRPGNAGFGEGLARAAEAAQELHYLCGLATRSGLVDAGPEAQALYLVKSLMKLRRMQRERTVEMPPAEPQPA
jgi:hypothetical protein